MDEYALNALRELDRMIPNINAVFFFDARRMLLVRHDSRYTRVCFYWSGSTITGNITVGCTARDAYDFLENGRVCNIINYNNLSFGRQEGNEFT